MIEPSAARAWAGAEIDAAGWLPGAVHVPSPNFDARPEGVAPTLLVVHAISLPPGEFGGPHVRSLFTNCLDAAAHPYFELIHQLRVSAHFFVRRTGELVQFVSCDTRAWHAGVSSWRGRDRCNDFSIGVELEGCDDRPFEDAQYVALDALAAILARRYPLACATGHSDIAPGRKTDPGPCFDWSRLRTLPVQRLA